MLLILPFFLGGGFDSPSWLTTSVNPKIGCNAVLFKFFTMTNTQHPFFQKQIVSQANLFFFSICIEFWIKGVRPESPCWLFLPDNTAIFIDRTRPAIKLWVYGRNSFHSKTFTNFVLEIDLDLFTLWGTWSRASVVIQNMIMLIQSAIASSFLLEMRCISMHWLFPKKSTRLKIGKTKLTCILY